MMITEKTRSGKAYSYDTDTKKYLNEKSGRWVANPRTSVQGKCFTKVQSQRVYYWWPEVKPLIDDLLCDEETAEQYWIIQTKLFQKENLIRRNADEDVHTHYYSDEWLHLAGSKYRKQLQDLADRDLVEVVTLNDTLWNRPVKGYRLNEIYFTTAKRQATVKSHSRNKGLNKYYALKEANLNPIQRQMFHMLKHCVFDLDRPTFLREMRLKYTKYRDLFLLKAQKLPKYKGKTPLCQNDYQDQQNRMFQKIEMWNDMPRDDRIEFFSSDRFGHRFHSIFSCIPSELRKYVQCKGQSVSHSLDLPSSQFVFAADMLIKSGVPHCQFIQDVESGQFYEKFADLNEFRGKQSRNISKLWSMNCLFGTIYGPAHKMFESAYPIAGNKFRAIKSVKQDYIKAGCHKPIKMNANLAMVLQRNESEVFHRIWNTLMGLGIFVLPVHDSVYVCESDVEIAQDTIKTILNDYFDLNTSEILTLLVPEPA